MSTHVPAHRRRRGWMAPSAVVAALATAAGLFVGASYDRRTTELDGTARTGRPVVDSTSGRRAPAAVGQPRSKSATTKYGRASRSPAGASADLGDVCVRTVGAQPHGDAKLDTELADRWAKARRAAVRQGVTLRLNSGGRSRAYQQALWDCAVERAGSEAAALRWVLPPQHSAHVGGGAIDVGPPAAAAWLQRHGSRFGLCRRYDNEPWHFEPLVAPGQACPQRQASAAVAL